MSRSTRFIVRASNNAGWFAIVDSQTGQTVTELKGQVDANRRCRKMNSDDEKPNRPQGYISAFCACGVGIFIPAGEPVPLCPQCERDEMEQRIDAMEERRTAAVLERTFCATYASTGFSEAL